MKDAPWDLHDPQVPSELTIDAYVVGEATPEEIAAVEVHCAEDKTFKAIVEARERGFDALPMASPAKILSGIEGRLHAQAIERSRPNPPWVDRLFGWRGLSLAGALIAATLAFYINWGTPPLVEPPPSDVILAKGGMSLEAFCRSARKTKALLNGAYIYPGDHLRFKINKAPEGGHALVVGLESSGHIFSYAPVGAERSIPTDALEPGGSFPGAAEVDDSKGREWAYLVWCPAPFSLTDLSPRTNPLELILPEECRGDRLELLKP